MEPALEGPPSQVDEKHKKEKTVDKSERPKIDHCGCITLCADKYFYSLNYTVFNDILVADIIHFRSFVGPNNFSD